MSGRTFALGDIHGEPAHLARVLSQLPKLDASDTLVFLGDYLDRGPHSKEVVDRLMTMHSELPARIVCLRGNHEDAWLRVCDEGWDEFVLAPANGCLATLRSFTGAAAPVDREKPTFAEMARLSAGDFLSAPVVDWVRTLPFWYEDQHAFYVHAGLPRGSRGFLHPSKAQPPAVLAWIRTEDFTRNYRGKKVLFGHTPVNVLPPGLSSYTPNDPSDVWINEDLVALDTGCGKGGFLTAVELPSMRVYESRVSMS